MQKSLIPKYNGEIVAGSLLTMESRKIASLLLDNANPDAWHQAIVIDNILQKRSPATAKRQARLIKNRLSLMKPELWDIIVRGSSDETVQALLAAAIKHSPLLGDFMDTVIRQHWRTFIKKLDDKNWKDFINTCVQVDPGIEQWTASTLAKLRQVIFRIFAESKYIDNTKNLNLLPVLVIPEIRRYLLKNSEHCILHCMEVTH
jgi:succinate dehydrogenase flavin-adding protein (antitoxin of CptAB toxin-antitoxin module)